MKIQDLPTPFYIVYEDRLRRNLSLINRVEREAGVNIIMAFKANALWRTFPIISEYNRDFTASSLNELRLGTEELGGEAHVYCPVYTPATIDEFLDRATHITFNSLGQWEKYGSVALSRGVSPGLRVNPQCSVIETDLYNPALPARVSVSLPNNLRGISRRDWKDSIFISCASQPLSTSKKSSRPSRNNLANIFPG